MQEVTGFVAVLVTTVAVAALIAVLYSFGLRLWEKGIQGQRGATAAKTVSVACFAACIAIVLLALWLIVPVFH